MATGKKYVCEYRLKKGDGSYRWTLTIAIPNINPDGSIKEWIGTSTDIHEFRKELLQNCRDNNVVD